MPARQPRRLAPRGTARPCRSAPLPEARPEAPCPPKSLCTIARVISCVLTLHSCVLLRVADFPLGEPSDFVLAYFSGIAVFEPDDMVRVVLPIFFANVVADDIPIARPNDVLDDHTLTVPVLKHDVIRLCQRAFAAPPDPACDVRHVVVGQRRAASASTLSASSRSRCTLSAKA